MESPSWSSRFKLVVGVIVFVLFCLLLYAARAVLPPIIIGVIIGYIFYPYARFIKYSTALPHRPATAILYLLLLAIIIPIVLALLPVISEQVVLVRDEILALLEQVNSISPEQTFELFGVQFVTEQVVQQVINTLIEVVRDLAGNAVNLVLNAAQVVLLIVITLIIGFYMTRDGDRFIAAVEDLIPDDTRGDIELLLAQIDNVWATFFRSNLLLAILVGTIVTALSAAIGLPRPLLMGILAGVLEFIPTIGHVIWLAAAVIIAGIEGSDVLAVSNTVFMVIVVVASLAYTQLDTRVLIPALIGDRDRLHPVVVIIGLLVGWALAGLLGLVLAAPTISSLELIGKYIRARLMDRNPFSEPAEPTEAV